MPPIDEVIVKIDRAREHLKAFDNEVSRFLESRPHRFTHEFEHKRGLDYDLVSRMHIDRVPPLRLSAIFGDCLHNMRSALDHLVFQLSVKHVGLTGDLKNIEFPIFNDRPLYFDYNKERNPTRRSGLYKIRSVDPRAQTIIESLQPYHGGDSVILWTLHELEIIDKHRKFHMVSIPLGYWDMGTPFGDGNSSDIPNGMHINSVEVAQPPYEDGTEVVRTAVTVSPSFDFKVRLKHQVPSEVIMNEAPIDGIRAGHVLATIIGYVAKKVIPSLEVYL